MSVVVREHLLMMCKRSEVLLVISNRATRCDPCKLWMYDWNHDLPSLPFLPITQIIMRSFISFCSITSKSCVCHERSCTLATSVVGCCARKSSRQNLFCFDNDSSECLHCLKQRLLAFQYPRSSSRRLCHVEVQTRALCQHPYNHRVNYIFNCSWSFAHFSVEWLFT